RDHADALMRAGRHRDHASGGLRIRKRDHEQDPAIEMRTLEHELVTRIAIQRERSCGAELLNGPPILFDDKAVHVATLQRPRDERADLAVPADHSVMPKRLLGLALETGKRSGTPVLVPAQERKTANALRERIDRTEEQR